MPGPLAAARSGVKRYLAFGVGSTPAMVTGVVAVAVLALTLTSLRHVLTRADEALILVVPVVGAAVLGGRRAAYVVALAATLAFTLVIPPVGSVRVHLAEDVVALIVFTVVALTVGEVVARRIELLGAVERQRTALLRAVSHDLRTPLSSIRAAASELAEGERLPPATARRLAEIIEDEADRLDRLVSNLLSMSRIEAGAFVPTFHPVDIGELVATVTRRLARLLKDARMEVDVEDGLAMVVGDETQLDQLLTNLVENAVRHSPRGQTVAVKASMVGGSLQLRVSDRGPGIDPSDMAAVFEPFRSGPVPGASGVGLAICKAVVEAHSGTIQAEANPGGGAMFTVVLPIA